MNPALCESVKGREMTFLLLKSPSVSVTFPTECTVREQSTQFQIHAAQRCVRACVSTCVCAHVHLCWRINLEWRCVFDLTVFKEHVCSLDYFQIHNSPAHPP